MKNFMKKILVSVFALMLLGASVFGVQVRAHFDAEQHIDGIFFKDGTMLFMQDNIFRVEADGSITNLTPFVGVMAVPVDLPEDIGDEILVMMNKENPFIFNIYRLNISTGDITLAAQAVEDTNDDDAIRLIIVETDGINLTILHSYFDEDEYVFTGEGRERIALVRMNSATFEVVEVVFGNPHWVEVADGVFVRMANIPRNIDGRQGQNMLHSTVGTGFSGLFAATFRNFTHGMSRLNAAILVGDREVALGMDLTSGDVLVFGLSPEDAGQSLVIRMSTNCENIGTVEVSAELFE